uniref:Elongation of very long chain fatty acids protein n=2 Tax=Culex pipiens TaxID=7175 RepID=A0A8D8ADV2_CULPI
MALVLSFIHQGFQYYHETQDPRTTELLVVNPPWLPVALVGGYLYFVLSLGPKLMKDRKPFNLRTLLLVYNVLQVAANAYLSCYGTYLLLSKGWSWSCQPFDKSTSELAMTEVQLSYYYVLLKLADLIDTVSSKSQNRFSHIIYLFVGFLRATQKTKPRVLPARVSSRGDGARSVHLYAQLSHWTLLVAGTSQHVRPRGDVLLLLHDGVSTGTGQGCPLEKVPDDDADGTVCDTCGVLWTAGPKGIGLWHSSLLVLVGDGSGCVYVGDVCRFLQEGIFAAEN